MRVVKCNFLAKITDMTGSILVETTNGPGNYLNATFRWWDYPSMHNWLWFDQYHRRSFCGTKKFHFYLLWVISCKAKRLWATLYKKIKTAKILIGEGMLVQIFKAIGRVSSFGDTLIFENVTKMS